MTGDEESAIKRETKENVTELGRPETNPDEVPLTSDISPRKILVAGSRRIQANRNEISELAKALGEKIMCEDNWILLNGGASETSSEEIPLSIDHLVCIGAQEKLKNTGNLKAEKERILTLLPEGAAQNLFHDIGKIEFAGATLSDRRSVLVKKADIVITIEGVKGTKDIISDAMKLKKPVLPIACTGGKSKKAWDDHEDDILQKFDINNPSEEYEMLATSKGIDDPASLSDVVIRVIKNKIIKDNLLRSWHDTPMHTDNPSEEDLLGRKPYAKTIASGIQYYLNKNTDRSGSFLVHIYGPWGSGKSTLLKFLKDELDPPKRRRRKEGWLNSLPKRGTRRFRRRSWIVVSFNAWQHQRIRPPWWLLMDAVYMQIRQKTPIPFSWGIWMKENGWRLWNGWSRAFWLATFSFGFIAVAIFVGLIPIESVQKAAQSGGMELLAFFSDRIVGGLMATTVSIITGIRAFGNSLLPASPSAASQFTLKTADPMQKLQRHFKKMISWTRNRPVAIFIDDLDRCTDEYTIEFLEGIQTIFRDAPNLAFVVAADRRWLYSSYQKFYGSFSETFDELGRPLGYLFIDKTFQISIPMPKLSDYYQEAYLHYLVTLDKEKFENIKNRAKIAAKKQVGHMTDAKIESKFKETTPRSTTDDVIKDQASRDQVIGDQALREIFVESRFSQPEFKEKTENFLKKFSSFMEPNPRSMKRLVTAFGIWRARDILSGNYVDEDKLAQWVIISQRWPTVANFLEKYPEIPDIIKGRRREEWDRILQEKGIQARDRNIFLDPAIGDVLLGNGVGKPLDNDTIRKLSSS